MFNPRKPSGPRIAAAALTLVMLAGLASAQDIGVITSVRPNAELRTGVATAADGLQNDLADGVVVAAGKITVLGGAECMIYVPRAEAAVIVIGPAEVALSQSADESEARFAVTAGRMLAAAGVGSQQKVRIAAATDAGRSAEAVLVGARAILSNDSGVIDLAFTRDGGADSLAVSVGSATSTVKDGERLTISADGARTEPASAWLASTGLSLDTADLLGLAACQRRRVEIETRLFANIIAWDRYAGAKFVASRLVERAYQPEVRQVAQSVFQAPPSQVRGTEFNVAGTQGANQVPVFSPAGLVVQNLSLRGIADADINAITAIQSNQRAGDLLTLTGSQGLGFGGLRQLLIPGFGPGGLRTVGPAGLGAVR